MSVPARGRGRNDTKIGARDASRSGGIDPTCPRAAAAPRVRETGREPPSPPPKNEPLVLSARSLIHAMGVGWGGYWY